MIRIGSHSLALLEIQRCWEFYFCTSADSVEIPSHKQTIVFSFPSLKINQLSTGTYVLEEILIPWGLLPEQFLKYGGVFLRGEIGVFRQHISKKRLLKLFWRKKCVGELVKFANKFPQMRMVFDFATHVGGHAWRNIVTNIIADSERHKLTSVTILTIVMLSFRHVVVTCVPCFDGIYLTTVFRS